MKKILIVASAIILILVGIRFANTKISEINRAKALEAHAIPTVGLSEVKEIEIYDSIELPGRVESQNKVDLVARIDGYLQKKHFTEGDYVKKGQLLITIEPTQYLNNLNKARAELASAKATLYKANRDYERGAELVKKDFISKSTYDGLKADKERASASVKAAASALAEAQRNYGYTSIKSPVEGKIGSLNIQEGNYVTINSGALATVTKTNPIYVKYSIDSKQFDTLRDSDFIPKKGSEPIKVKITLSSGKEYPISGVQDFWDNQISTSTGTIDFRATFKNDEQILIPGDFVKVKVFSSKVKKVLVIPQDIALEDSTGRYVFVLNDDNTIKQRYFKDGGQYTDDTTKMSYWIIDSPLIKDEPEFKVGDKFVSTNLTSLMAGMPVKITENKPTTEEKQTEDKKEE